MQMFVVGGAVRDKLMGMTPKDVDYVVVGSTPEEMLAQGFKQVGADFPVFLDDDGNEFALARTERKSGRGYMGFETDASPTVTLTQDLMRRDLTVNAMAHTLAEEGKEPQYFDPFGGARDLEHKVLRHVSEAFADDPVRVLRLARFHARYGEEWRVAPVTMAFAQKMVLDGELAFLTRERVLMEMEKALSEQAPHLFFRTLFEVGALKVVFPELAAAEGNMELLELMFTMARSRSGRFNWAKLTTMVEEPENFEKRLNVSTHWRAFSKMFRTATALMTVHPVERLYQMDAYRNSGLFLVMLAECEDAGFNMDFLKEAYEATKHVSFNTLQEGVRDKLVGHEITAAIKKQRMFAYDASQLKV